MKQAQQWERFHEDMKNLIGRKKIRRQSHLKPLTLSFFTSCSIVLRITRAINGFTPNLLIAIGHFTVMDESEAESDLVLIQTFFALLWKLFLKNTS